MSSPAQDFDTSNQTGTTEEPVPTNDILRQAELFAISMQSLATPTGSKNSDSSTSDDQNLLLNVSSTSDDSAIDFMIRESQELIKKLDQASPDKVHTRDTAAPSTDPIDYSSAATHSQTATKDDDQELDMMLEEAGKMVAEMKSSVCKDESTTDNCNVGISGNDKDIDALLGQADTLASQIKSSGHSIESSSTTEVSNQRNPSSALLPPVDQESEQLDEMLGRAEVLVAQMKSSGSGIHSKSATNTDMPVSSDVNNENQEPIDDMLHQAEVLAAQIKSESRSVDDSKGGEASNAPSTPKDGHVIRDGNKHSGAADVTNAKTPSSTTGGSTMDTPTLIRETESILGAVDPNQPKVPSGKAIDTPALIRRTDALLAKSDGQLSSTPTAAATTTLEKESPIDAKKLLGQMEAVDEEPRNESSKAKKNNLSTSGDHRQGNAGTSRVAPKKSLQESANMMEQALTALRQASAECSTPTPPESHTPTSVSVAPVMDEVSSVGSGSIRSLASVGGDVPKGGGSETPNNVSAIKNLPERTNLPPLVPRTSPNSGNDAVHAVLEETRQMALYLEQVSGAKQPSNQSREAPKEPETSAGVHAKSQISSNTAPMNTLEAAGDRDSKVPIPDISGFDAFSREIDPCAKFEQESTKVDPYAKYVKMVSASAGDTDYAPIADYTPRKSRSLRSRHSPTTRSPKKQPGRTGAMWKVVLCTVVALLMFSVVVNHRISWPEVSDKDAGALLASGEVRELGTETREEKGRTRAFQEEASAVDIKETPSVAVENETDQGGELDRKVQPIAMELSSKPRTARWPLVQKLKRRLFRSITIVAVFGLLLLPFKLFLST